MKFAWMVCSLCRGAGLIDQYTPHSSQPNKVECPQCSPEHWANDRRCVAAAVPDGSMLPTKDSLGRDAADREIA